MRSHSGHLIPLLVFRGLCLPILCFVFSTTLVRLITARYLCHFNRIQWFVLQHEVASQTSLHTYKSNTYISIIISQPTIYYQIFEASSSIKMHLMSCAPWPNIQCICNTWGRKGILTPTRELIQPLLYPGVRVTHILWFAFPYRTYETIACMLCMACFITWPNLWYIQ
jgi:hypothetical protein